MAASPPHPAVSPSPSELWDLQGWPAFTAPPPAPPGKGPELTLPIIRLFKLQPGVIVHLRQHGMDETVQHICNSIATPSFCLQWPELRPQCSKILGRLEDVCHRMVL